MPTKAPASTKPSDSLRNHRAAVRSIVAAHRASNARVFGSVARGVDDERSDLDILIDPTPDTTLFDIGAIRHELRQLLGTPVDLLTPNALPDRIRDAVLAEATPV
jgi:predicted nucleotidyltransferase